MSECLVIMVSRAPNAFSHKMNAVPEMGLRVTLSGLSL
jgi:hypothetical protein